MHSANLDVIISAAQARSSSAPPKLLVELNLQTLESKGTTSSTQTSSETSMVETPTATEHSCKVEYLGGLMAFG
jgi:hypothetical protein